MPRLLMSASSARVTGTIELASADDAAKSPTGDDGQSATIVMVRGLVTKVKTTAPVAYLGAVLYELGYIETHILNDSLHELSRARPDETRLGSDQTRSLHGEILLTRGAITHTQLLEGLHEQTTRKLVHLFTLPATTSYSFHANVDRLASWGGADFPHVDPGPGVWRGVREGFSQPDIDAVFAREAQTAFRLVAGADATKFEMSDVDLTAVEWLRGRSLTAEELAGKALIDPRRAREIVYFLLVTKLAEPIDLSGVRPAYRPDDTEERRRRDAPSPSGERVSREAMDSHTKPTRPAMPAVSLSSNSRPPSSRPENESAEWRAVARSTGYASSAKIAVSEMPVESGKMPIASGSMSPGTPSSAWKVSPSTPASAWNMSPNTPPSAWKMPPNIPSSVPPRISMGAGGAAEPMGSSLRRPTPLAAHYPSGQFSTKAAAELVARRQSISDRSRSVRKEDYFQRLGLEQDASQALVEQAFAAQKTLWDPDLLPPQLEGARSDCAFVLSCLVEAFATLRDPVRRAEYLLDLSPASRRTPADQLEADLVASGAKDPYEGAKACFARGDLERAERLARCATTGAPEAAKPLALLAWIEATKPANSSPEETRRCIALLDRALNADEGLEQAYYWRALLHKRLESHADALLNFRRVVQLNPRHTEAIRELRVYEMRIRRSSITMKGLK